MKKILTIFAAAAIATAAYAQKIENSVPVAVFVPESVDNVPEEISTTTTRTSLSLWMSQDDGRLHQHTT